MQAEPEMADTILPLNLARGFLAAVGNRRDSVQGRSRFSHRSLATRPQALVHDFLPKYQLVRGRQANLLSTAKQTIPTPTYLHLPFVIPFLLSFRLHKTPHLKHEHSDQHP